MFKKLKQSFGFAFKGIVLMFKEPNFKIEFFCFLLACSCGFWLNISPTEWLIILLCSALVLSLETVNTAIEKFSDFVHPDYSKSVGAIKDISAGAVFISSIFAALIGGIIFFPKLLERFF